MSGIALIKIYAQAERAPSLPPEQSAVVRRKSEAGENAQYTVSAGEWIGLCKFIDPAVAGIGADYLWSNHNWRLFLAAVCGASRFPTALLGFTITSGEVSIDRIESILVSHPKSKTQVTQLSCCERVKGEYLI